MRLPGGNHSSIHITYSPQCYFYTGICVDSSKRKKRNRITIEYSEYCSPLLQVRGNNGLQLVNVFYIFFTPFSCFKNRVHIQNVPRDKTSEDKTSPDKTFQDIRSQDIRSQGIKRPRDKTSRGQNVPRKKCPQGQNVPRDKTSYTLINKISKTNFVLENWPHMLGNGAHPCTQFMIGVFLFIGGQAMPFLYPGHIGLGNTEGHKCTEYQVMNSIHGQGLFSLW